MREPAPKNNPKLLLISDSAKDVLTLRMMSADIKDASYELVVAKDLKQGIGQLGKERFELVLLDLTIKGNKGLAALNELNKQNHSLPVVILTAREDTALAMEAVKCGAQDYLNKSRLDANVLARVVHYAIERPRVMEEMKEKDRELLRLNALKSELVSTVSHELRTPLTVIMSSTNNMLDGALGSMSDDQKKWVKKINGHAQRLHDMINDILDLSKLQSGKTEIRRGLVEAKSLVRTTVDNLAGLAQEKGLLLSAEVPDNPTPVWADSRHVERVLTNLLSNAIKYTPAGGKIIVTMRAKGGDVEFSVADTGAGIAPEHQETIFERFRQIRRQRDSDSATQGIGLGLAICKEIISQHNGKIWVESTMGKGSKFLFLIPSLPSSSDEKAA